MKSLYLIFYYLIFSYTSSIGTKNLINDQASNTTTEFTPYTESFLPSNTTNDVVLPYDGNLIGSYNENDVILDNLMEVNHNISKSSKLNSTNRNLTAVDNTTTNNNNNNNVTTIPQKLTDDSNQTLISHESTRSKIRTLLHRSLDNLLHKQIITNSTSSALTGGKLRDIPHPVVIANTTVILSSISPSKDSTKKDNKKNQLMANLLNKLISKPIQIQKKNITVKNNGLSPIPTAKLINKTISHVYNALNKLLGNKNYTKTFHVANITTEVKQIDRKKLKQKSAPKKAPKKIKKSSISNHQSHKQAYEEDADEFGPPKPLKMIEMEKRVKQALNMNLFTFLAPISMLGLIGRPGDYGEQGTQGYQGQQGIPGHPGSTGPIGVTGRQGPKGHVGPIGNPGEPGQPGEKGPSGDPGIAGVDGKPGDPGLMGLAGEPGYSSDEYVLPNCSYICGNEKYWLECKKFEVLNIITALWGREEKSICPNSPIGLTTHKKCRMQGDAAWKKLSDQCNNRNACEVIATNLFFDDNDNDDIYKYTKVCYECSIDEGEIGSNNDKKRRSIKTT